jgi:tryptophanyl-tRNA synthetase
LELKRRLTGILQATIAPIRERRATFNRDPDFIMDVLRAGATRGRVVTERTKEEINTGLGLFRL